MKRHSADFRLNVLIDALHAGGVEKVALNQVIALNKIGIKSNLLVLRRTDYSNHPFVELINQVPKVFLDDDLPEVLKISFKFPFLSFFSLYHLTYPLFLPFVVSKGQLGIIIAHGTYTCFSALAFRLLKGVRYYASIWDPINYILKKAYPQGPIKKLGFVFLPLARLLDWLIVVGAQGVVVGGKAHVGYLESLGVKRIESVSPGVNPAKIPSKKQSYIIVATSWKEGKRPEYNLEILSKLVNVKMVVAGNWQDEGLLGRFQKMVKQKKLARRVEIRTNLSEEELQQAYSRALVFLQTNDDRGFGMAALEAASAGTSFVIPKGQGVGELFEEGRDGFFTSERNTKEIVAKLKLFLGNEKLAVKMGRSAWRKVVRQYSWEKHVARIVHFVTEAA